jgi:hypothetical protein
MLVALVALVIAAAGTASADRAQIAAKSTFKRVFGPVATGNSSDILVSEAKCPDGYGDFGGGYIMDGVGTEPFVNARVRKPDGWEVKALVPPANPAAGIPVQKGVTLKSIAYCVKFGQPLVIAPSD